MLSQNPAGDIPRILPMGIDSHRVRRAMKLLLEEEKRFEKRLNQSPGDEHLMRDNLSFYAPVQSTSVPIASGSAHDLEQKAGIGMPLQLRTQKDEVTMEAWQSPAALSHSLGARKGVPKKGALREYVLLFI